MCFIEKEHQLRFFRVAYFRQVFEQFGYQPDQESRVETAVAYEFCGVKDVDHAFAVGRCSQPVVDIQIRLAEEFISAVHLKSNYAPGYDIQRRAAYLAVIARILVRMLADEFYHGFQVFGVDQKKLIVIGDLENYRQKISLQIVQLQDPCKKHGASL